MKRKETKRKIDNIWDIHHSNNNKLEQKRSSIRRELRSGWLKTILELYPRMIDLEAGEIHSDNLDGEGYKKFDSYIVDDYHQDERDDRIKFHPGDD